MLPRVLKRAVAVMGLALALACGGAEPMDGAAPEGVSTEAQAPATEAVSSDTSAQGLPGCGAFKQPCCEARFCNTGLVCDTRTLRCLY